MNKDKTIGLATYGRLLSITRKEIIDDDMDAFVDANVVPLRTYGTLVWTSLEKKP